MKRMGATPDEIEAVYRKRFRGFLLGMTAFLGDGDAALDVVQDGFARALQSRLRFRADGDLEAWIWRIVLNGARDRLRSRRREGGAVAVEGVSDPLEPGDDLVRSLRSLPERQRLAIFLRYYADLSYEQIADALGVSPGTVAASLHRAHAALRRELSEVRR